jgi:hypothetical protein
MARFTAAYESERARAADLCRRLEAERATDETPRLTLPRNPQGPPRQEHYILEFRSYVDLADGCIHNGLFDPQDPAEPFRRSERSFART